MVFLIENIKVFKILFNDNHIGYSGMKSLWEAKQSNSTITDLNVDFIFSLMINVFLSKSLFYNRFSWDSMLKMSKLLTDPSLTSLNLLASFFLINQSSMFVIIQDFMQALLVSQGLLYYPKH